MGSSTGISQPTDDKLLLLKQEQKQYAEGTASWHNLQTKIDQIVAQRLLEYVNS